MSAGGLFVWGLIFIGIGSISIYLIYGLFEFIRKIYRFYRRYLRG